MYAALVELLVEQAHAEHVLPSAVIFRYVKPRLLDELILIAISNGIRTILPLRFLRLFGHLAILSDLFARLLSARLETVNGGVLCVKTMSFIFIFKNNR